MSDDIDERLDEQVEDLFPLGGYYSNERTRAAGRSIAALVRYLNHATYSDAATPYPSTIDSLYGSLDGAIAGLEQLIRQTGRRFGDLCQRDDAYSTGTIPPAELAGVVDSHLTETLGYLDGAQRALARAQASTSRVGLDEQQAKRQRGER